MSKYSFTLTDKAQERLMKQEEFTIENLQKWLSEGEAGLPYVFFAIFDQQSTNNKAINEVLKKQDDRIAKLEICLKDVKPIVEERKSLTWLKNNILGIISFVSATVNFYLLIRSLNLFSNLAGKVMP